MSINTLQSENFQRGNHEVVRQLTFQGMKIAVETDKGQSRTWYDKDAKNHGSTVMKFPYGYFVGTKNSGKSGDGMALDVYVGPEEKAKNVYVVHQMKKPDFKEFDELKVMIGFESARQARISYLCHYSDEKFLGDMDTLTVDEFKDKYLNVEKALGQISPIGVPNPNGMVAPMGMPMMPMGPPPIDVETLQGVESLLSRVGNMKDTELLSLVEEIWGPGYQYMNASPELVRCEVCGFLLDQRDLLKVAQEIRDSQNMFNTQMSSSALPVSASLPTMDQNQSNVVN